MTEHAARRARTTLAVLLRSAVRLDRSQSDPVVALRNAIGVAAPLAIGTLLGSPALGLLATVGALQSAFADRPGPYPLRMLRMVGTSLAAGITSALAVVASGSDAGSVVLLLVLAFIAGLLLAGGQSAAQVGTAGTAAALVIGHTPLPPSVAVHVGLLVLAGGSGQAVLAVAAWPLRRHRPERMALARLYRELAGMARTPPGTTVGPPVGDALNAARATLFGLGHDHGPSVESYRVLVDEAERLRREIVVVAPAAQRLADEREPILAGLVRAALAAAGGVLDRIADALEHGRLLDPNAYDAARGAIKHAVHRLEESSTTGGGPTRRVASARLRALAGQLRAAVESASTGASEGGRSDEPRFGAMRALRDPVATVRANLTLDSAVLRHAVRAAILVAASDIVLRLMHVQRGYWVALTLLVVLRPDFGATVQRAVLRVAGTIIGLLLGTALVHWVPGGSWWQVALILFFAFGMRLAGPGNFGLTAVSLSGLVVVLLEIGGVPAHTTFVARSVATLIGGGLAVLAILAFPTWERNLLPQRLALLLDAYRRYLVALFDPASAPDAVSRARSACRVARTNAQASLDRASAEPVPAARTVELGRAVLTHSHRFIHATMALDAIRGVVRDAGSPPELDDFLRLVQRSLIAARTAVTAGKPPQLDPALRRAQERLAGAVEDDPGRVGGPETAAVLVDASDRMTDALDTLIAELRRQLGASTRQPVPARASA